MKKIKSIVSILVFFWGVLGVSNVFAHDPGEQMIGSATWRTLFFCSVVLLLGLVMGSLIERIGNNIIRTSLFRMVTISVVAGWGYFVYHGFID